MKLIDILRSLPSLNFQGHGPMISFSDIVPACARHGQKNDQIIEQMILVLEKENVLQTVYDEQDLLIGVKLRNP